MLRKPELSTGLMGHLGLYKGFTYYLHRTMGAKSVLLLQLMIARRISNLPQPNFHKCFRCAKLVMKVRPRDWSEGYDMTSKVPVLDFDEKSRKDSSALFVYGKSSFTLNFRDERAHTQRQKSDKKNPSQSQMTFNI